MPMAIRLVLIFEYIFFIERGEKMASKKIIAQKEEAIKKLAEQFKEDKLILLVDYRGINVEQVTKIRSDLRNANAKYEVIKNNIIKRALNANGENGLEEL